MYQVTMVTLGPVGLMKSSRKQKLFKDWVGQGQGQELDNQKIWTMHDLIT